MKYRKDFKHFEKKPNAPYTKPIPVLTFGRAFNVEGMLGDEYRERMQRIADWHQFAIDNTNPKDPIFAQSLSRHRQIRDDAMNEIAKAAYGD